MTYVIFTIKDRAIDAYLRPFYAVATGQAVRIFTDEINNPQGDMGKHPDDYDLYKLGTWDDISAAYTTAAPELVVRGKDCKHTGG